MCQKRHLENEMRQNELKMSVKKYLETLEVDRTSLPVYLLC